VSTPGDDSTIVEVKLPDNSYPVMIGSGVRNHFSELFEMHAKGKAFWITDKNVADAWGEDLGGLCSNSATDIIILPPGEDQKRVITVERICQILVKMGAERGDTLVACGGGVVGDIVNYEGISYRVVSVEYFTGLASVGGKTGVDLPEGKNLIGAFHQPKFVLIDVDFLNTLDDREFRSGFAEVVKSALLGDPEYYKWLVTDTWKNFFQKQPEALSGVIEYCVRFKADIVEKDERESDLRRILNFGHTIGHALETLGDFGRLRHGEALYWGLYAAIDLSVICGKLKREDADPIMQFIDEVKNPIPTLSFRQSDVIELLAADKKIKDSKPNFILLEEIGKPVITNQVDVQQIEQVLDQLLARMRG